MQCDKWLDLCFFVAIVNDWFFALNAAFDQLPEHANVSQIRSLLESLSCVVKQFHDTACVEDKTSIVVQQLMPIVPNIWLAIADIHDHEDRLRLRVTRSNMDTFVR